MARLLRPFSLEDGEGGAEDAEGVQVQGAVGDVVVFQLQALLVLDVGAAVAAPPAGEPGLHLVVQGAPSVGFQLAGDKRARADGGHLSLQYVEELRQLIQGCAGRGRVSGSAPIQRVLRGLPGVVAAARLIIAAEMLRRSRLRCCGVPRCAATR